MHASSSSTEREFHFRNWLLSSSNGFFNFTLPNAELKKNFCTFVVYPFISAVERIFFSRFCCAVSHAAHLVCVCFRFSMISCTKWNLACMQWCDKMRFPDFFCAMKCLRGSLPGSPFVWLNEWMNTNGVHDQVSCALFKNASHGKMQSNRE